MGKRGGLDALLSRCGQKWPTSSLPALAPSDSGAAPSWDKDITTTCVQPEDLGKGQGGPSQNQVQEKCCIPWARLILAAFVLTPPGWGLWAEFLESRWLW